MSKSDPGCRLPASESPSRTSRTLLLVTLVAAALKLIVLAQLGRHPLLQPAGELDSAYYVELAHRVQAGDWLLGTDAYFLSPLYVYFVGLVFILGGGSLVVLRIVQVVLGAAAVWLIGATARIWFPDRTGVVAAVLATACGLFTFYEILVLQAALDPFLTALALFLVRRALAGSRSFLIGPAAGMALGLLSLNRPNGAPYAIAVVVLIALSAILRKEAQKATIVLSIGILVGLSLALAPVTIRNYRVTGEFVPISSHGGLNFYIGNNAEADGTYHAVPGITPSIAGQVRDARHVAEGALGRQLGSGEVSDYFYSLAWQWLGTHPREALRLQAKKLIYLLNSTPLTLNYSYTYYARDESSLLTVLRVGPGLLVPLGIVGLFVGDIRRRDRGFWIWAAFVPVYGLSVAVFFISSRYRMPLLVPLCVSSAAAIEWLWTTWRGARLASTRSQIAVVLAAIAALAVVANWNLGLDDGRSEERTQMIQALLAQGQDDEAMSRMKVAERDHTQPGLLYYRVGRAFHGRGKLEPAIAYYERALTVDRNQPEIRYNLGQALLDDGRAGEAMPHLEAACREGARPDRCRFDLARALAATGENGRAMVALKTLRPPDMVDGKVLYDAGHLALQVGDPAAAERFFSMAVVRTPTAAVAHEEWGVALSLEGRHREAIVALEQAWRLDAKSASIQLNLAVAYASAGELEKARTFARAALALNPDYRQAKELLERLER